MPQVDWKTTLERNWLDSMQKEWNIKEAAQLVMLASMDSIAAQTQLADYFKGSPLDSFELRQLNEASITLAKNEALPLNTNTADSLHVVFIGHVPAYFKTQFNTYHTPTYHHWTIDDMNGTNNRSIKSLEIAKTVVFVCFKTLLNPTTHQQLIQDIQQVQSHKSVVLVNFDHITNLIPFGNLKTVVQIPSSTPISQDLSAQFLFGAIQAKGHLPLTLSKQLQEGQGIHNTSIIRLKYALPESVKMKSKYLEKIEYHVNRAIRKKAMPGGQVLIAKDGKVIYNRSFGYHTYDKKQAVKNSDSYDIASVTKVAATTLALMQLYDNKAFDLNDKVKTHLPQYPKAKWRNLKLRHLMTHRSGLQSNAPISQFVRISDQKSAKFKSYFSPTSKSGYPIKITKKLYMSPNVQANLWKDIATIKPKRRRKYHYSDVNFQLLQKVIETKTQQNLSHYMAQQFYKPLGLQRLTFNPLEQNNGASIIPTIDDKKWRKEVLKGAVHDETAALLGGIGGHAGLFSNANDLAILGQLLLNKGVYGGHQYLDTATVELFTKAKHGGHRGLGFDIKTSKGAAGCYAGASRGTYGHSGFTGTCLWIDPVQNLVYVFLSNRVHPNPDNKKLIQLRTREQVHRLAYKALGIQSKTKRKIKYKRAKLDKKYVLKQGAKKALFDNLDTKYVLLK